MVDKLKIELMEIEKIKEYENNVKLHPESQIKQIAKSIEKFGFNDPIAIDQNNVIIEGHGRLKASKLLKLKKIPVLKLNHLTESQKKAYILAHNKLTTNTGYDQDILSKEIESIIESSEISAIDLESIGIDFESITQELEKEEKKQKTFEDEANEYNDQNCKMPIVPNFFEKHECFLIPVHNEIDEKFIRDFFDLNENYKSNSGDGKVRKTNVISLEKIRCLAK